MRRDAQTADSACHMPYSKPCKKQIQAKIALHYPQAQREAVWERVKRQYTEFLSDWRTDLGGRKNLHNGVGGTYDCIALMSYYTVCREATSVAEIEAMESALFLPPFRRLGFVDCNRPFWKRAMHWAFASAQKQCGCWRDYIMALAPYEKNKPIRYEFTACPIAEFAKQHDLVEVMPAMCNPDYAAMELLHARLVRTTTCADGCKCDYTICGDRDEYPKAHPEYVDEQGFKRNKR